MPISRVRPATMNDRMRRARTARPPSHDAEQVAIPATIWKNARDAQPASACVAGSARLWRDGLQRCRIGIRAPTDLPWRVQQNQRNLISLRQGRIGRRCCVASARRRRLAHDPHDDARLSSGRSCSPAISAADSESPVPGFSRSEEGDGRPIPDHRHRHGGRASAASRPRPRTTEMPSVSNTSGVAVNKVEEWVVGP